MLDQSIHELGACTAPREGGKLGDVAYSQLYEAIIDCRLEPGVIFREASLAEQFGFGLAPARRALARLDHGGLARSEKRRGWRVLAISGRHLGDISLARELLEPAVLRQDFGIQFAGELAMRARILGAQLGDVSASPQAVRLELSLLRYLATAIREPRVRGALVEAWDLSARADIHFASTMGMRRDPIDVARLAAAVTARDVEALAAELARARDGFKARSAQALANSTAAIVAEAPELRRKARAASRREIAPQSGVSQSTQGEDQ